MKLAKEKFSEIHLKKLKSVVPILPKYNILFLTILNLIIPEAWADLLDLAPSAIVVGSGNAIRYLEDIINKPFNSLVVKDGDTLDLGNKTLKFISAPNLHWPDSMFTYLEEDKILFTCDVFRSSLLLV